jgi:hypothetical protein
MGAYTGDQQLTLRDRSQAKGALSFGKIEVVCARDSQAVSGEHTRSDVGESSIQGKVFSNGLGLRIFPFSPDPGKLGRH